MTPKEKAREMIQSFTDCLTVKDCALVAVYEILELTKKPTYNPFDWNEVTGVHYDKYWLDVRQEIKNL